MSNEKENINIEVNGNNMPEIIIRHGEAQPPVQFNSVCIAGSIESVAEYIKKRIGVIDREHTHITIDRENAIITLVDGEHHGLFVKVQGSMLKTKDFTGFKINKGVWDSPKELGEFLRRQKRWFVDKSVHAKLVESLLKFKATVNKEIEKIDNKRGSITDMVIQKVTTEIPERFVLELPIFKGCPPSKFEVEIFFDVRDAGCKISLDSIEAEEAAVNLVDQRINEQIPHFKPFVTVEI